MRDYFTVQPGGQVLSFQPRGFSQVYGIWVDNFSGGWLGIDGLDLWVPPYTRGWKAEVMPGSSSITARSYDFANGVVIAGATGQAAKVTLWDEPAGNSEGIDFFDQQTIPKTFVSTRTMVLGANVLVPWIAAPTVGRLRVYEVGIVYALDSHTGTPNSVYILFYDDAFNVVTRLEVSPAAPSDTKIIQAPGGDLPIGSALNFDSYSDSATDSATRFSVFIRYAVI